MSLTHNDKGQIKKANNIIIKSNDSRLNYSFYKEEDIENFENIPVIIGLEKYDYCIKSDNGSDIELPKLTPLSLAQGKNNLEYLEEWYRAKFPNLPDEYHGILARYSNREVLTKKETKNALKKYNKKNKQLPVGMSIAEPFDESKFTINWK